jgi:ABC-2 type transport system permease protein
MSKYNNMLAISIKEIKDTVRDRRVIFLTLFSLVLALAALVTSFYRFETVQDEREALNQAMREDWETQEEKHAHGAAHYGTFIFVSQPLLSFIDFGVKNYTGSSIRIEAHLQNDAQFSEANENGSILRFGEVSVALVLQTLLPLLLIFITFGAVTREREGGTLKLLVVQGVSISRLLWQKINAYFLIALVILTFVFTIAILFTKAMTDTPFTADIASRVALMFVVYGAFYFLLISTAIVVSAICSHSTQSLVILLGIWLLMVVVVPKLAVNVGDSLYPLQSKREFQMAVYADVAQGVDGHNPKSKRSKQFIDAVLKKYGARNVDELKINIEGLLMQEDEDYRAMVTRKHFDRLSSQIENQNRVSQLSSFINPLLSVKTLSMALAETDYNHHVIFEQQVQEYRLYMMRYLNEYMSYNNKPGDWTTPAPREVFRSLKPFVYNAPSARQSLAKMALPATALLCWLILAVITVNFVARKMRVI